MQPKLNVDWFGYGIATLRIWPLVVLGPAEMRIKQCSQLNSF
jgi:hypothetical protein